MNFNNINGVWPQIKDYIDSKLGEGVSKYKHMIYIQNLFIINDIPPINNDNTYVGSKNINDIICIYNDNGSIDKYTTQQKVWKFNDRLIFYVEYCGIDDDFPIFLEKITTHDDCTALVLKEGWYINCMGQIYDWKGNIVE